MPLDVIRHLCDIFFPGMYGPSGTVSAYRGKCVNGNSKKFEFQLSHISVGGRHIDPAECYDGFRNEVAGCNRGGRSRYSN